MSNLQLYATLHYLYRKVTEKFRTETKREINVQFLISVKKLLIVIGYSKELIFQNIKN